MLHLRRSGRINRELDIVLLGTDTAGRVFSENTKTVVLSRHGAGILSRHRFSAEDVMSLRLPGERREAEVRLVGEMGERDGCYVYGVEFRDSALDFWQIPFPPAEPGASAIAGGIPEVFECSICGTQGFGTESDIEADVYAVSQAVLRSCPKCGLTTRWEVSTSKIVAHRENGAAAGIVPPPIVEEGRADRISASQQALKPDLGRRHSPPVVPEAAPSAYSGALDLDSLEFGYGQSRRTATVLAERDAVPAQATKQASPPQVAASSASSPVASRRPNRRKHVRIRVTFTACVRDGSSEEIVECENMSKQGLCFRSRTRYAPGSTIEIAAPFGPGSPTIFVPGQVTRAEELPTKPKLYRHGIAFATR